jgi:multiple sugar transport system permease protein
VGDEKFWISIYNTLAFTVFMVPLGIVFGLCLALLLNMRVKGLAFYRTIFFLPSIVPLVASSVLWLWVFNYDLGVFNWVIRTCFLEPLQALGFGEGWTPPNWFADPPWAKPALIIMGLWGVGGSMVIYLASLQEVPKTLYEAADIDGASAWQKVRHVTLPTISPVIFFTLIMGMIGTLQVFTQAYIMTGGGPADATLFYALYLFNNAFEYFRLGYASAMAWILFIIILALTLCVFRGSKRFVHYEG